MAAKKLTIKEIAKLSGISVSTVSRAINNHYDISPETKRRVQEVIDKYGYVPNNSARNLKLNDARNIAVLVKGITNPFFTGMLKVFEQECTSHNYSLVLEHVEESQDMTEIAALLEKEKRLNGIVFLGGNPILSSERLKRLAAPYVFCSVAVTDRKKFSRYAYVSIDDRKEAEVVTDYLIGCGRKRIAILCADERDISIGSLRLEGYLNSLKKHGIEADPELICRPENVEETYTHENGYQSTMKLVKSGAKFDAIFAISDSIAIGCLRALRDCGIEVPKQVSVVGFDGLPIGKYLVPSLTTLKQPVEEMAEASMKALLAMIAERDRKEEQPSSENKKTAANIRKYQQIFSGTMQERESCRKES